MEIFLVILFLVGAYLVAGFKFIPTGYKAIRVRLGRRDSDRIYDEGLNWRLFGIDQFLMFGTESKTQDLGKFSVETGSGLSLGIEISCIWKIDQDNLREFSNADNTNKIIENHLRDFSNNFFRKVQNSFDIFDGAIISKFRKLSMESLEARNLGYNYEMLGENWREVEISRLAQQFDPMAVRIQALSLTDIKSSDEVRAAYERNKRAEVDADSLNKVAPAVSGAVGDLSRAGVTPDLALRQTERTVNPDEEKTEADTINQLYVSGPGSGPGAVFSKEGDGTSPTALPADKKKRSLPYDGDEDKEEREDRG